MLSGSVLCFGWSSFVADIAEKVKVSVSSESADNDEDGNDFRLCEYFPTFVWVVRDFTLELSADGKAISPDDYLENAFTLKKGLCHFSYLITAIPIRHKVIEMPLRL